jgi:ketol-acid reductoisomerase
MTFDKIIELISSDNMAKEIINNWKEQREKLDEQERNLKRKEIEQLMREQYGDEAMYDDDEGEPIETEDPNRVA